MLRTFVHQKEVCCLFFFLKKYSYVTLSNAMSLSRFEYNIRGSVDIILHSKNFASLEIKLMNMSRLSFASTFKLLNEEFGIHSKDDGEAVPESLNKERS